MDYALTSPTPPRELVRAPGDTTPALRDAMNAALAGDFHALDLLEVTYLNVLVRIGELVLREPDGTPHAWALIPQPDRAVAPFVTAYRRGFGPDGHAALEWQLCTKCRRCEGRLRRLDCRVCGGTWWVEEMMDREVLYSDTRGVLFEAWA